MVLGVDGMGTFSEVWTSFSIRATSFTIVKLGRANMRKSAKIINAICLKIRKSVTIACGKDTKRFKIVPESFGVELVVVI